jgi:photosystem II stability/assembly factor-like uncharacterized protein
MKNILILSFLILSSLSHISAQSGWFRITSSSSSWYYSVEFVNSTTGFAVGMDGKILRTTNALNFSPLVSGTTAQLEDICFVNANTGYIVGSGGVILKTSNGGDNWIVQYPGGSFTLFSVYFTDENYGHAAGAVGLIRSTTNGGITWDFQTPGTNQNFTRVVYTSRDTGFVCGLGGAATFLKTTNRGANWIGMPISSGLLRGMFFINSNTGFACGSLGKVMKTTNAGVNWNELVVGSSFFSFEDVYFVDQNTGYLVGSGKIVKTTNQGTDWIIQTNELTPYLYSVFFTNANTGYVAGENGGIWKTTTGGGQFIGILQNSNSIPDKFSLQQNYPNPFNPFTNIKFDIPKLFFVKIIIFDVLGREIETIVNQYLNPGSYQADWNASSYPSGIYFYKMETESFSETKKMMLIK